MIVLPSGLLLLSHTFVGLFRYALILGLLLVVILIDPHYLLITFKLLLI